MNVCDLKIGDKVTFLGKAHAELDRGLEFEVVSLERGYPTFQHGTKVRYLAFPSTDPDFGWRLVTTKKPKKRTTTTLQSLFPGLRATAPSKKKIDQIKDLRKGDVIRLTDYGSRRELLVRDIRQVTYPKTQLVALASDPSGEVFVSDTTKWEFVSRGKMPLG